MTLPVASVALSRRLMRVNIAYTIARMKVIEARSGEPVGIRWFGDAVALMARKVPSPSFNAVVGLRDGQEHVVGEIDDWYRENKIRPRFAIAPDDHSAALGKALAARGFAVTEFDTVLYGLPPDKAVATGVAIEQVDTPAVLEKFLDTLLTGWGIPHEHHEGAKGNMRGWLDVPGWQLYLARIDGKPAAAAKLFLHDGVGYFADAATRPEFRGRGLQAALLRHRAAAAAQAGAELTYSQAASGSTSQHNMERVGLRVLSTRAIWTR